MKLICFNDVKIFHSFLPFRIISSIYILAKYNGKFTTFVARMETFSSHLPMPTVTFIHGELIEGMPRNQGRVELSRRKVESYAGGGWQGDGCSKQIEAEDWGEERKSHVSPLDRVHCSVYRFQYFRIAPQIPAASSVIIINLLVILKLNVSQISININVYAEYAFGNLKVILLSIECVMNRLHCIRCM